ncbi:MAG TPA: hypothetical protein VME66_16675 [Candidatus Acidoferrales bacterium]|nr:hypothetical protein [Candidatus Acidoferrales bacterium]
MRPTFSMGKPPISKPNELLQMIADDWNAIRNFNTCSWSTQRQLDMLATYQRLSSEVEATIVNARGRGAGTEANEWRAGKTLLESVVSELRMWLTLKENDGSAAWNIFCDAEQYALNARNWLPPDFEPAKDQVEHLRLVERVAFPYQAHFTSLGAIVGREVCTICESEYGTCDHLAGELYDGYMCASRCEEIKEVLHLAIVLNPRDKRNRIMNTGGVDPLTGIALRGGAKPKTARRSKGKRKRRK